MSCNYYQKLIPDARYHLFSRAVGFEKLFLSEENYRTFLRRLIEKTDGVIDLYAYSLLPNHFHLLVKIKPEAEIISQYESVKLKQYILSETDLSDFIMERFSNFLNGYAKAFNIVHQRKGALFMDYMKRSVVDNDNDFSNFIFYIHKNAMHHGLANAMGEWPFDSYNAILNENTQILLCSEVLDWFGGKKGFVDFHKQPVSIKITQSAGFL